MEAEAVVKKPAVKKPVHKTPVRKPKTPAAVPTKPAEMAKETALEEKPVAKAGHGKNYYGVGRRKTSVTQALMTSGNGTITINKLPLEGYFQTEDLRFIAMQPLTTVGLEKTMNVKAKVQGGGIHSQAESFRHAVARAIILMQPESRRTLKKLGFLIRDPRVKERKKPGLKRARRAPQFSKR
jgi:small subunit ribosomal protein S9